MFHAAFAAQPVMNQLPLDSYAPLWSFRFAKVFLQRGLLIRCQYNAGWQAGRGLAVVHELLLDSIQSLQVAYS